jgi:urea transport system ATP-binding protein
MTVQENIELGLQPIGGKGKIPDYIYDLFPILPKFAQRKGGDLSGGQQQQLAIARALVAEPKILILDDPTEGIQPSIIQNIGAAIKKINEWKGITILLVEQYLDFVMEHTDSLYVMEKGKIIYQSETKDADKNDVQKLMTD